MRPGSGHNSFDKDYVGRVRDLILTDFWVSAVSAAAVAGMRDGAYWGLSGDPAECLSMILRIVDIL